MEAAALYRPPHNTNEVFIVNFSLRGGQSRRNRHDVDVCLILEY